jgi:hypothetical protein
MSRALALLGANGGAKAVKSAALIEHFRSVGNDLHTKLCTETGHDLLKALETLIGMAGRAAIDKFTT